MINTKHYWHDLYHHSQALTLTQESSLDLVLNHDLGLKAQLQTSEQRWQPSPAKGVKRLLLERLGGEKVERATSLVSYEPESFFASHLHPRGEEFLVLSGTFSDEYGDYPEGTYVRNPPGSRHKPFSQNGCLIFVKLQQFQVNDNQRVVIDTNNTGATNKFAGYQQTSLFDAYEKVEMIHLEAHKTLPETLLCDGAEILLLAGRLSDGEQILDTGTWLRAPSSGSLKLTALENSTFYLKHEHLG